MLCLCQLDVQYALSLLGDAIVSGTSSPAICDAVAKQKHQYRLRSLRLIGPLQHTSILVGQ